jgi:hypothetical protein
MRPKAVSLVLSSFLLPTWLLIEAIELVLVPISFLFWAILW